MTETNRPGASGCQASQDEAHVSCGRGEVPESAAEVVAYLRHQHDQIRVRLEALTSAQGDDRTGTGRESMVSGFVWLLAVHEATEQQIVHLRAEHELADGPQVVAERLAEEQAIAVAVTRLCAGSRPPANFSVALTGLRALIGEHFAREERQEFAGLRVELGVRQLARMRRAVQLLSEPAIDEISLAAGSAVADTADGEPLYEGFERSLAAAASYIIGDPPTSAPTPRSAPNPSPR